jgi:hypothetical protein
MPSHSHHHPMHPTAAMGLSSAVLVQWYWPCKQIAITAAKPEAALSILSRSYLLLDTHNQPGALGLHASGSTDSASSNSLQGWQ